MTDAPEIPGRPVYSGGPIIKTLERAAAIASLLALLAVITSGIFYALSIGQISHERKAAVTLTCGVLAAVSSAGWDTVTRGVLPETPFARALERLGYPPYSVRKAQAEAAGNSYVAGIARRIFKVAGRQGSGLILPHGQINCRRFARLAGTD